ncbi:MAG: hypothetical protein AAF581_17605 [Planctomycetota bacterium]
MEQRKREKRVLLSPAEEALVAGVIDELGESLGVRLTFSDVARSALFLLRDALPRLLQGLPEQCELRRPPTRSPERVEEFERVLRKVLFQALQDAGFDDDGVDAEARRRRFSERFQQRLNGKRGLDRWLRDDQRVEDRPTA